MDTAVNPNGFAYLALFSWPIVTLWFYQRLPIGRATVWSILGAFLLLPVGTSVDLAMIPPLDKATIPNVAAYLACRIVKGKRVSLWPRSSMARRLMLVYVVSPFVTALLNPDPIVSGSVFIKGMDYYDALSAVIRQLLFILPFLLGMDFLHSAKDHEDILKALAVAGLVYSLPMWFEVRMSPQLHTWVYGYFPHSFVQHMREGGFRPVVFIGHGLWVAFFTMTAVVAASALWRIGRRVRGFSSGPITAYLLVLLLGCKSLASLVYAMVLAPLVRYGKPSLQVRVASLLVLIALAYPLLRGLDWFPTHQISEWAATINPERAQSFDFRMRNENILLNKAHERPWFGWGSWGRNRVYDQTTGRDLSVTDGRWIIVLGQFGWIGMLAEFGLLAFPVLRSLKALRYVESSREAIVLGALTLILGINVLDLLPNNSMSPWTWLLAGALLGRTQQVFVGLPHAAPPAEPHSVGSARSFRPVET